MKISLVKKLAGLAVAGTLVAGAGTMAWADSTGGSSAAPTATTAPAASTKAKGKAAGRGLAILKRADHGDVEIKVKGSSGSATWQTVTFDRGQVSDVAADHITVARPDGKSVTLTINASTKYRGIGSWQQVAKSQGAIVVSENGTATLIIQRATPAASATPAA